MQRKFSLVSVFLYLFFVLTIAPFVLLQTRTKDEPITKGVLALTPAQTEVAPGTTIPVEAVFTGTKATVFSLDILFDADVLSYQPHLSQPNVKILEGPIITPGRVRIKLQTERQSFVIGTFTATAPDRKTRIVFTDDTTVYFVDKKGKLFTVLSGTNPSDVTIRSLFDPYPSAPAFTN